MSMSSDEKLLRIEQRSSVTWIVFEAQRAGRALDGHLGEQLVEALRKLRRDASLRCVVITGEDRTFYSHAPCDRDCAVCSGSLDAQIVSQLRALPVPIIAAINGDAVGAGAAIALSCDLRFVSEDARLIFAPLASTRSPAAGLSWSLPRTVGRSRALELLFTGRPILASEALQWGLVAQVVQPGDLVSAVETVTAELALVPRNRLAGIKRSVNHAEDVDFDEAAEFERLIAEIPTDED